MSNESENKLARRVDDKRAEVPLQWNESDAATGGITSLEGLTRYDLAFTGSMQARDDGDYVKFADVERLLAAQAAPASPEQVQAAERDLCTALLACPHTMDEERVVLYRNFTKEGNAYAQIADRLAEAFAKLTAPIAAAPAAEEVQWISTKDRMPDDGQVVLILCHDPHEPEPGMWSAQWSAGSETFESRANGWVHAYEVSHWMPLPAVPASTEGGAS